MSGITFSTLEIRSLTEMLFTKLEQQGLRSVRVPETTYWTVFFNESFQDGKPELVRGDVVDDLNDLRREVEGDGASLWHAFHHLSGLLNLMAYAAEQGDIVAEGVHQ